MRRASVATAILGLAGSLLLSLAAWVYFDTLLVFLLVPFVPILFRRRGGDDGREGGDSVKRCPECGFESADPAVAYCPRHGTRLE
jgi:hypothetical protein